MNIGSKKLLPEVASTFCGAQGRTGDIIGLDHFGASAPGEVVMEKLGFNVDNVVHRALQLLHRESTPATRRTWVNAGGKT